jgi:hypothetical protein
VVSGFGLMRNDDTAAADASSGCLQIGRRVLAWALHGPPWTYLALAVAGLLTALLVALLKG